jgi:flagellar basal-body rod modification protein FlgD
MAVDATSSATNSAASIQMDYMKLLVTQMKNQNPLEPMSNTEMASQMAQFTQLQQLETMNTSFSQVLKDTKLNYANSLIGKSIAFEDTSGQLAAGTVERVTLQDSDVYLKVGTNEINVNDVLAIQ